MKVHVEFVGAINTGPHKKNQEFEIASGTTIRQFIESLHFDKSHINFIQVVRNGTRAPHSDDLVDGDKLELMLMVGGG